MTADPALATAVALIAGFEGFRAAPYQDSGGVWTIGYGFTYLTDGSRVTHATPEMTRDAADERLSGLVARTLGMVRAMVHVSITDSQAAALCSFAYNEGTGALRSSTLLRMLNQGEVANAADCFMSWVYAGGNYVQGLHDRRVKERALFLTAAAPEPESDADRLNDEELRKLS